MTAEESERETPEGRDTYLRRRSTISRRPESGGSCRTGPCRTGSRCCRHDQSSLRARPCVPAAHKQTENGKGQRSDGHRQRRAVNECSEVAYVGSSDLQQICSRNTPSVKRFGAMRRACGKLTAGCLPESCS